MAAKHTQPPPDHGPRWGLRTPLAHATPHLGGGGCGNRPASSGHRGIQEEEIPVTAIQHASPRQVEAELLCNAQPHMYCTTIVV